MRALIATWCPGPCYAALWRKSRLESLALPTVEKRVRHPRIDRAATGIRVGLSQDIGRTLPVAFVGSPSLSLSFDAIATLASIRNSDDNEVVSVALKSAQLRRFPHQRRAEHRPEQKGRRRKVSNIRRWRVGACVAASVQLEGHPSFFSEATGQNAPMFIVRNRVFLGRIRPLG